MLLKKIVTGIYGNRTSSLVRVCPVLQHPLFLSH